MSELDKPMSRILDEWKENAKKRQEEDNRIGEKETAIYQRVRELARTYGEVKRFSVPTGFMGMGILYSILETNPIPVKGDNKYTKEVYIQERYKGYQSDGTIKPKGFSIRHSILVAPLWTTTEIGAPRNWHGEAATQEQMDFMLNEFLPTVEKEYSKLQKPFRYNGLVEHDTVQLRAQTGDRQPVRA